MNNNFKLKNITVATEKNIGYYSVLVESCKRNNIDLIVLGLGQKWTGFTMRLNLWLNYLNKLDDNEIVMINDAYDVIIIEDSLTIIDRFKKMNKKVVFGSQEGFFTNLFFSKCFNTVLCCGNIIGYVKYIKLIILLFLKNKHLWKKFNNDDQLVLNYLCKRETIFKKFIGVDINKEIFFIASDDNRYFNINYILDGNIKDIKMKNRKILNKNNKSICVLHLPALLNGNKYLNYLGYDTKNIKLQIKSYKFIQGFGLFKNYIILLTMLVLIIYIFNKFKARFNN